MVIVEDSRQKANQHEIKHTCFNEMGVNLIRCKLPFGDYAHVPKITVDTKANMQEIAQNIGSDHKRFKNECVAARDAGCQLIILVENTEGITSVTDVHKWVNPDIVYRPKSITGVRLEKAMITMTERYGVRFEFCHPNESATRIMELLGDE